MLSRTADHLYWMARYTERAENLARMLDVSYRMSLLPQASEVVEQSWLATLSIIGVIDAFRQLNKPATPANMLNFMAFDRNNPSSIYNCLKAARENAHAVRGTLTSELWETMNSTWLEMRDIGKRKHSDAEIGDFFEWVKFRSHLAHGVTQNTMLRDEAFHFTWLGTYLERADNTARILDVKYHLLLPDEDELSSNSAADYYQWSALLHSASAFEIYRKVYSDVITPHRVAELLILRSDLPRSLHRCMSQAYMHLCDVRNAHSAETERRAGELQAALRYGRIEEIFETGLHDYLMRFIDRIKDLGERVARDFLVSATGE
ncbi:MAG TPA: alpha-E domain-containing protein [Steroidobacteraceae bacterium]|jgi:uncharacterized alpha-E superfamily protein|nr:alpha-E domain-containing protein [Steroidobacteraceae bacterium]